MAVVGLHNVNDLDQLIERETGATDDSVAIDRSPARKVGVKQTGIQRLFQ